MGSIELSIAAGMSGGNGQIHVPLESRLICGAPEYFGNRMAFAGFDAYNCQRVKPLYGSLHRTTSKFLGRLDKG
jgi:hypothetical protein